MPAIDLAETGAHDNQGERCNQDETQESYRRSHGGQPVRGRMFQCVHHIGDIILNTVAGVVVRLRERRRFECRRKFRRRGQFRCRRTWEFRCCA